MARAVSINALYNKKRKLLEFEGEWKSFLGNPEHTGSWIVWGNSGSGKTTFLAMLGKYLSRFGRVAYNSMEEGDSESMKLAFKRVKMEEVKGRVVLLDNEPVKELKERLRKHKAPSIIILDSLQYSGMNYSQYKELRNEFKNVLFVIVSHAEGREPAGKVAKQIRFDAFVKIRIEGYKAFPVSRFGGGEPLTVWEAGAKKFYASEHLA